MIISPHKEKLSSFMEQIQPGQIAIALFDSFPDVLFWIKDRTGTFLYVNRAFSEFARTPLDKIIGSRDSELFPGEFAEIYIRDDEELLRSGRPLKNKDELIMTHSGLMEWRATSKIPLLGKNDEIIGTAGFSRKLDYHLEQPVPGVHDTLAKILNHIQKNIHLEITVTRLAELSKTSVSTIERMFRTHLQTTPKQFVIRAKIAASCRMLIDTDMTVSEIAQNLGYAEHASFTRMFTKTMQVSPLAYRRVYKSR